MILKINQKTDVSEVRNGYNRVKKYIPTVPLRGAFYSAASGSGDRRRIMPAAPLAPSVKNFGPKKNIFFGQF